MPNPRTNPPAARATNPAGPVPENRQFAPPSPRAVRVRVVAASYQYQGRTHSAGAVFEMDPADLKHASAGIVHPV